eukprot:scaffold103135_cov71-Cyclotella_meneghiniana.AAC.8
MLASGWTPEGHFATGGSKDWSYLRLLDEEPIDKPETTAPTSSITNIPEPTSVPCILNGKQTFNDCDDCCSKSCVRFSDTLPEFWKRCVEADLSISNSTTSSILDTVPSLSPVDPSDESPSLIPVESTSPNNASIKLTPEPTPSPVSMSPSSRINNTPKPTPREVNLSMSPDSSISTFKPTIREVNVSNSPIASIANTPKPTPRENNLSKSPVAAITNSGKPTTKEATFTSSPSNPKASNGIEHTLDAKAGRKSLSKSGKSETLTHAYIDPNDEEGWAEYSLLDALPKTGKKDSATHSLSMHTFTSSTDSSKSSKQDASMSQSNDIPLSKVSKRPSKSSKSHENEMSVVSYVFKSKGSKSGFQLSVSSGSQQMSSSGSKSSKTYSHSYSLSMAPSPEPNTKDGASLKTDTAVENEILKTPNLPKHQDNPSSVGTAFEPSSKDDIPVMIREVPSSASSRNLLFVIAITVMICLLLAEPSVSLAPTTQKRQVSAVDNSNRDLMSEKKAKAIKSASAKAEKIHSSKSVNGKGSKTAHVSHMESMSMPSSAPSVSAAPSKSSYYQIGSGKSSKGVLEVYLSASSKSGKPSSKAGKASSNSGTGESSHYVSGKSSKNGYVSEIGSMSMHSSAPSATPSESMGHTIGDPVEGFPTSGSATTYASIMPSSRPSSSVPTSTDTPVQSRPNDTNESQVASIISTSEPTPSPTMIDYIIGDASSTSGSGTLASSAPTSTANGSQGAPIGLSKPPTTTIEESDEPTSSMIIVLSMALSPNTEESDEPTPSITGLSKSPEASIEESEEPTLPTPSTIGLGNTPSASIASTDEPTPANTLSKSPVASFIWLPIPTPEEDQVKGDVIPTTKPTYYGQYLLGLADKQNRDPSLPESQAIPTDVDYMLESLEDIIPASNANSRSESIVAVFLILFLQVAF